MATNEAFCTNCGSHLGASVNFCVNCGAPQSEVNANPPPNLEVQSPRGIFDVLGETYRVYKRNFVYLIAIVAIVKIPLALLGWLVFLSVDVPTEDEVGIGFFIDFGIKALVLAIVGALGWILMQAALIHAISEQSLGRPIRIQESYVFARSRYLPMLGTLIVAGIGIGLMAITVIGIPFAIAFVVYWFFILQIVALEGYGTTAAISRSYNLVRGNWWWTVGFLIVSGILIGILSSIITGLLGVIVPGVGGLIGEILMGPLMIIAQTLFYFELRNRQTYAQRAEETS